jgi:hypothetical protein
MNYATILVGLLPRRDGHLHRKLEGTDPPDDLPGMIDLLKRDISAGRGEHLRGRQESKEGGTWLTLPEPGFVVRRDRNGRAARMVGIHTPICQDHQAGKEEERR